MSQWGNVHLGKCPSGKFPVGELSVRGNVRRRSVHRGSVSRGMSSAKCQSVNCPAGKLATYQYIELTFNSQGNLSCVTDSLCIWMPMSMPDAHISIWPMQTLMKTQMHMTLHKKWSFPLRISSLNVTKFAISCGFGHIY